MIIQYLILSLVIFFAPLVPPVLSPLGFGMTGALVAQNGDLRILSCITVGVSTITAMIIRKLQNYVIERLTIREKIEGNNFFSRIINTMNSYFKKEERIARIGFKREKYIETKTGRTLTFIFAIFCFLPIIPDIISTRILYKKIKFPYFIIAVIIGKSITHIPFVFVGKSVFEILKGWRA